VYIRERTQIQQECFKPNQNPAFTKNWINQTERKPKSKNVQEPKLNPPHKEPNKTRIQMSWFLLGSFTEWNCKYIRTFHSKPGILLYLG